MSIWAENCLLASCCCYTGAVLPFLFSLLYSLAMFFCYFSKFRFIQKSTAAAGLLKASCQRNHMSFYRLSQYFHNLQSHTGSLIHCRRQSLIRWGVLGGYLPRAAPPSHCPLTRLPVGDYFTCFSLVVIRNRHRTFPSLELVLWDFPEGA